MASSPRNRSKKTEATPETAVTATVTLTDVIAATQAGNFVYTSPEFHNPLIASGQVEINVDMTDEHGNIATRAVLADQTQNPKEDTTVTQPEQTKAVKPTFEIKTASQLPTRVRKSGGNRAGRAAVYPFDELEINQYFFVPNKDGKSAAKSLASTVAGANKRHSEVIEGQTRQVTRGKNVGATVEATKQLRKFVVFDSPEGGVEGAKVFRVAVEG